MRRYSTSFYVLALLAAAGVFTSAGAATLTFGTGDFAGWTRETFRGVADGQTVVNEATGGNPGANLLVTTVTGAETFTGHFDPAIVLNPSLDTIQAISASIDYLVVSSFGDGHGVGLILMEQAGSYYYAGGFTSGSLVDGIWKTFSVNSAGIDQFIRLTGSGSLDFGASGGPIRLGFWTGNSAGNGIAVRYDNWNVTVNPVPAPPAFVLTLTAVAAAFGWSSRRRVS
jgi:hypothetical protein